MRVRWMDDEGTEGGEEGDGAAFSGTEGRCEKEYLEEMMIFL